MILFPSSDLVLQSYRKKKYLFAAMSHFAHRTQYRQAHISSNINSDLQCLRGNDFKTMGNLDERSKIIQILFTESSVIPDLSNSRKINLYNKMLYHSPIARQSAIAETSTKTRSAGILRASLTHPGTTSRILDTCRQDNITLEIRL